MCTRVAFPPCCRTTGRIVEKLVAGREGACSKSATLESLRCSRSWASLVDGFRRPISGSIVIDTPNAMDSVAPTDGS